MVSAPSRPAITSSPALPRITFASSLPVSWSASSVAVIFSILESVSLSPKPSVAVPEDRSTVTPVASPAASAIDTALSYSASASLFAAVLIFKFSNAAWAVAWAAVKFVCAVAFSATAASYSATAVSFKPVFSVKTVPANVAASVAAKRAP